MHFHLNIICVDLDQSCQIKYLHEQFYCCIHNRDLLLNDYHEHFKNVWINGYTKYWYKSIKRKNISGIKRNFKEHIYETVKCELYMSLSIVHVNEIDIHISKLAKFAGDFYNVHIQKTHENVIYLFLFCDKML